MIPNLALPVPQSLKEQITPSKNATQPKTNSKTRDFTQSVENSKTSSKKYEIKTSSGKIGAVKNLKYFNSGSTTGFLRWTESNENIRSLNHYRISINNEVYSTKKSPFTIKNLQGCNANYTVKVSPIANDGREDIEQVIFIDMNESLMSPTKVSNLTFNQTENEVFISWDPPDYGKECNQFYNIKKKQIFPESVDILESKDEFLVMKDLLSCLEYSVEISAVSVKNQEGPSNVLNIQRMARSE